VKYLRGIILTAHNYINKNIFSHIIKLLLYFFRYLLYKTNSENKIYMDANNSLSKPTLVQKEEIGTLIFPHESIERTEQQTKDLNKKLQDAMTLGNLHQSKIKIVFEDSEGLKEVETTVWVAGENYISLKAGVSIPVRRIVEVRF